MSEIADFIEAQYAKREVIARRSAALQMDPENGWGIDGRAITPHIGVIHEDDPREHIALNNPAFVLADIESKREILKRHYPVDPCEEHDASFKTIPCDTLRLLAAPFSVEPGYKETWTV